MKRGPAKFLQLVCTEIWSSVTIYVYVAEKVDLDKSFLDIPICLGFYPWQIGVKWSFFLYQKLRFLVKILRFWPILG